jgi:hypothetical protein
MNLYCRYQEALLVVHGVVRMLAICGAARGVFPVTSVHSLTCNAGAAYWGECVHLAVAEQVGPVIGNIPLCDMLLLLLHQSHMFCVTDVRYVTAVRPLSQSGLVQSEPAVQDLVACHDWPWLSDHFISDHIRSDHFISDATGSPPPRWPVLCCLSVLQKGLPASLFTHGLLLLFDLVLLRTCGHTWPYPVPLLLRAVCLRLCALAASMALEVCRRYSFLRRAKL